MNKANVAEFNKVTIIKPAVNSGRFLRRDPQHMTEAVQEFYGTNEMGQNVKLASNPYTLQRFDGTMQKKGPKFNHHKRRWTIIDPEDPTKTQELEHNSDVLDEMVAQCKLINDVPNHPQFGQYITKTDITDKNDPFFVNAKTKLTLKVGEAYIPTGPHDHLNKILILALMTLKEFQVGNKKSRGRGRGRVRYTIVDRAIDRKEKRRERELDEQARKILYNLSDEKKLRVAIALNLIRTTDVDSLMIDDLVWEYATDTKTKIKGGITKQQDFVQLCEKGNSIIDAKYIFHVAKASGVVRMQNKEYTAFGERLGKTVNEAAEFIARETNNMYEKLANAVNAKGIMPDAPRKDDSQRGVPDRSGSIENNSKSRASINLEPGAKITLNNEKVEPPTDEEE